MYKYTYINGFFSVSIIYVFQKTITMVKLLKYFVMCKWLNDIFVCNIKKTHVKHAYAYFVD